MKELVAQAAPRARDPARRPIVERECRRMAAKISRIAAALNFNGLKTPAGPPEGRLKPPSGPAPGSAEPRVSDADVIEEMARFVKSRVLPGRTAVPVRASSPSQLALALL
jgi:flagellin-like hook-associated protein FlgL